MCRGEYNGTSPLCDAVRAWLLCVEQERTTCCIRRPAVCRRIPLSQEPSSVSIPIRRETGASSIFMPTFAPDTD